MKAILTALVITLLVSPAYAGEPSSKRLYGKWSWTYAKNNCTEIYEFRPDNTSIVTSGEEIAESAFTISDEPTFNGFYQMVDVVTKSNGHTGCDGTAGGTPVGDKVTDYVMFHPVRDEMIFCMEPALTACMGPLRRVSQ